MAIEKLKIHKAQK